MTTPRAEPSSRLEPGRQNSTGERLIPHRPGLDGLRGLAIVVVLAFHGGASWMTGGFLGVSLFFTLSGFLITSLLVAEYHRDGRVDLGQFWSRRFRRLLPAALLALLGIGLFGLFVATAEQAERLSGDIGAALIYVANWRYVYGETSYAELWGEPSPVLHFWSLAIEEQAYLILPLVVVAVLTWAKGRRWILFGVLAAITAASVAATFVLGTSDLDRIYFGTDTRAAELLAGALLAVGVAMAGDRLRLRAGWLVSLLGVGAIATLVALSSVVDTSTEWLYRGGFPAVALVSVLAIYSVTRDGPLGTALGSEPLRWLGTRSYGIYLFHWPVFLWLDADTVGFDGLGLIALRLAVTFVIAELSFRLVESPIRYRRALRRSAIYLVPPVSAVVLAVALLATSNAPAPLVAVDQEVDTVPPPPTLVASAVEAAEEAPYVLVGDSIASRLGAELSQSLQRRARVVLADASTAECSWYEAMVGDAPPDCGDLVAEWAEATDEAEVVIVSLGVGQPEAGTVPTMEPAVLHSALQELRAAFPPTAQVVWVTQPVVVAVDEPDPSAFEPSWQALDRLSTGIEAVAAEAGDEFIDMGAYVNPGDRVEWDGSILEGDDAELALGLGWASDQISRPRIDGGGVRILVVGDSVAYNLGRGIEEVASRTEDVWVWNAGTAGCGIVRYGQAPPDAPQLNPTCFLWPFRFESHLADFDPHVVLVISSGWDLGDRRLPDGDRYLIPGDPEFDRYFTDEYRFAVDLLSAQGAQVVWGAGSCVSNKHRDNRAFRPERAEFQLRVLNELAAERTNLGVIDLDELACPGGRFTNVMDEIRNFRPDGVHYSDAGTEWMAERILPRLLDRLSPGVDIGALGG